MKQIILTIILFNSFNIFGQLEVDMNWKLSIKDTLVYKTVMQQIDSTSYSFDFKGYFDAIEDSASKEETLELVSELKKLNDSIKNTQYAIRLYKKKKKQIEIEMYDLGKKQPLALPDSIGKEAEDFLKSIQSMNKGVLLRGSINENGTIHSFWIKRAHKNLIALLFELPGKPVKVGDSWSLKTNLVGNDQNFICDSSYRKNEVTLINIKKVKNELIAILEYDIIEYVNGTFNMPSVLGKGGSTPTIMSFGYKGIAEFSIKKGRWITYEGIMFMKSTGIMASNQRIKYSLIEQ